MKLMGFMVALAACSPALADDSFPYPVPIPSECVVVAQREHVSTVMRTRTEAVQAALKLNRLSDRDPNVVACKQSVARLRAAL